MEILHQILYFRSPVEQEIGCHWICDFIVCIFKFDINIRRNNGDQPLTFLGV